MKSIRGYEGVYEMDEDGVIFSVDRCFINSAGRRVAVKRCRRKPIDHMTGYQVITLSKDNNVKTYRLHRLIAETLIENPENKPFVNHKDGNKKNNHPSNLEWSTEKENSRHAIESGLFNVRGVNNPACRFTYEDVTDWYFLLTQGVMIKDVAKEYECDRNTVTRLIKVEYEDA